MASVFTNIYISFIAIAFGCSIINFTSHPVHLKLLSLIVGFDLIGELSGFVLYNLTKNNLPVYNIVLLGEFTGYAFFFNVITKLAWLKRSTLWIIIIFPIFWFISVFFLFGLKSWNSYVYVAGSLLIICFAVLYYYELIKDNEIRRLNDLPEFWVVTGLIIFYAANLPFLGMLNFLIANHPNLADKLSNVLRVLNIIMYSLFAYAYVCQTKISFRKSQ